MPYTPMSERLPEAVLAGLSAFIARQMGLDFPPERWGDLSRGVAAAAREFGHSGHESFASWLRSAPLTRRQIEALAGHLTVGETYFFRDKRAFEVLEGEILPELIRSRQGRDQRLRCWSAGCATGEEAYSLAILLDRLIPHPEAWNLTLLATDITRRFLSAAAAGVYGGWSFRDCPPGTPEAYFERLGDGRVSILPRLRRRVTFSYLNLAEDVFPSLWSGAAAMDVILCRNVLMYFTPEAAERAVANLSRCLVEGGWLVVGPTETWRITSSEFEQVDFSGAIFYRKKTAALAPPKVPACQPVAACGVGSLPPPDRFRPSFLESGPAGQPPIANPPEHSSDIGREAGPAGPDPASTLYNLGRYAEAAELLRSELSRPPRHVHRMALLSRACANQGRLGEALAWCDRALRQAKLTPALHYLRASILQEQGRAEEAGAALGRVLYLDPRDALAHLGLAHLDRQEGRLQEADKHFDNALLILSALPPDAVLQESEGLTAGRLKEMIAAFRAVMAA